MKTAFVTGGSRGIGACVVRALCQAGVRVAFTYCHSKEKALALQQETGAKAFCCDVTNSDALTHTIAHVLTEFRHIDFFIHSAGIAQQALFHTITDPQWHTMQDTHVSSAFYASRALLPSMISQKYGRIIFISSIWGQVGASCEVHYSTAKAGLIGMTKALAKEVAPSGVTVNCVCPGVIATDMLSSFSEEDLQTLAAETPVGRLGTPQEVAHAVCFFVDDASSFITGQVLSVDGGFASV